MSEAIEEKIGLMVFSSEFNFFGLNCSFGQAFLLKKRLV